MIVAVLILVGIACYPVSSRAAADPDNECKPDLKAAAPCPTGKRNDIDPNCIAKIDQGQCLNTMPTSVVPGRVPEDVCKRSYETHPGMDYAVPEGTIVYPIADNGWVYSAGCVRGGGNAVYIWYAKGNKASGAAIASLLPADRYQSVFMHLSVILVSASTAVNKTTPIGKTGGSSGCPIVQDHYPPHLHMEIRDGNGQVYDPMCTNIQGLCGGDVIDSNSCRRDCKANPDACTGAMVNNTPGTGGPGFGPGGGQATGGGAGGTGNASYSAASTDQCSLSSYRDNLKTCLFCDIFKILFNTASEIAEDASNTLSQPVVNVVLVAFALWLAIKVMVYVSSFEVKDPRVMIKEILHQAFIVLVVVVILNTRLEEFMNLAIDPIFVTGFSLAQYSMGSVTCTGDFGIVEGGLPFDMGGAIVCTIKAVQDKIMDTMAVGSMLMCIGLFQQSWNHIPLFPHFGYLLSGLGVWLGALFLMLIYPWLLIDVVLQLSVAVALMPAAIGAYAFKVTRKYVGKIFETFMSAMFTFIFLTIVIYMVTAQLDRVLQKQTELLNNAKDVTDTLNIMMWSGGTFLQVVFISLLGWAVLGSIKEFTNNFAKGGINLSPIGSMVGGMAMSATKAVGKGAAGVAKPYAKIGAGNLKGAGNKMMMNFRSWQVQRFNVAGAGQDATTKNRKTFFGMGRIQNRSQTTGVNGRRIMVKNEETRGKHTKIQTRNDNRIELTRTTYANGMVKDTSKIQSGLATGLVRDNGHIRVNNLNQIRNESAHDQMQTNEAILRELVNKLMPGIREAKFINEAYKEGSRTVGYDENGNFEISQENADGSKSSLTWKMQGETALVEAKQTSKDGKVSVASSDGMVNMLKSYQEKDGQVVSGSVRRDFSFSHHYQKNDNPPISKKGTARHDVNLQSSLYSQEDKQALINQYTAENGRGNLNLAGFI